MPTTLDPLDGAAIRRRAELRRRGPGRTRAPLLAGAAVIVVSIGTWWVVQRPAHEPSAERPPTPTPTVSSPAPTVSSPSVEMPRQITERAASRLLAAVSVPTGAVRIDRSPTSLLNAPSSSSGNVDQVDWFTAPGTVAETLHYLSTHPPAGTTLSGTGTSGTTGTGPQVGSVFFDASGSQWQQPTQYTGLSLVVAVVDYRGGVAIRIDAEALWLPQRTSAEQIPATVTSVDVTVVRPHTAPTVHRTLEQRDAQSLAAKINALPVFPPGDPNCPIDVGFSDTLVFHDRSGTIRVEIEDGGCGPVTVYRPGPQPTLRGGPTIDDAIVIDLGLPSAYGR